MQKGVTPQGDGGVREEGPEQAAPNNPEGKVTERGKGDRPEEER